MVEDIAHPSPLGAGKEYKGFRRVTLADARVVVVCADCPEVFGTFGQVRIHRRDVHGMRTGGNRGGKKPSEPAPLAAELLDVPLGELLELVRDAPLWAELFESQAQRLQELAEENQGLRRQLTAFTRAMNRIGFVIREEDGE